MNDIQKLNETTTTDSSFETSNFSYFLRNGQFLRRVLFSPTPRNVRVRNVNLIGGSIEANWRLSTAISISGVSTIFCHNPVRQEIQFYFEDEFGNYQRIGVLGSIGPEWRLQLAKGPKGQTLIFGHNRSTDPNHPDYQGVRVWLTDGFTLRETKLGTIGTEWDLHAARFSSTPALIGIQNKQGMNPGLLKAFFLDQEELPTRITHEKEVGRIPINWQLHLVDLNAGESTDIIGHDEHNNLMGRYAVSGDGPDPLSHFSEGYNYGKVGKEWQRFTAASTEVEPRIPYLLAQSTSWAVRAYYMNNQPISKDQDVSTLPIETDWILQTKSGFVL